MPVYQTQRRTWKNGGTQDGQPYFVVIGPGATPYVMAENQGHADYLAAWLNKAYSEGRKSMNLQSHRAKAAAKRKKPVLQTTCGSEEVHIDDSFDGILA